MQNSNKIFNKLNRNVHSLEKQIKHLEMYNIRNLAIRLVLKNGMVLRHTLPFVTSFLILANSPGFKDNLPFHKDEIMSTYDLETIDTSNGIHLKHLSDDYKYEEEAIEYSTGWKLDNMGLYERTVTSYRVSDVLDLNNPEKILSMSKEEIEQSLVTTNIRTIRKNALTPEDDIYNSAALIVVNHKTSEDKMLRSETSKENLVYSAVYMSLVLGLGIGLKKVKKILVKEDMKDKYERLAASFKIIEKDDIEDAKKILDLRKKNLQLLAEEPRENEGYSYQLKKRER